MRETGARSRPKSYVRFGSEYCRIALVPIGPMSSMWPSGALFVTRSLAMAPPAPGRFSTTTCCPRRSASFSPSARETLSMPPPGGYPARNRMGFDGYDCAVAMKLAQSSTVAATNLMSLHHNVLRDLGRARPSFDHVAGAQEHFGWKSQPERARGLLIQPQQKLVGTLERQL